MRAAERWMRIQIVDLERYSRIQYSLRRHAPCGRTLIIVLIFLLYSQKGGGEGLIPNTRRRCFPFFEVGFGTVTCVAHVSIIHVCSSRCARESSNDTTAVALCIFDEDRFMPRKIPSTSRSEESFSLDERGCT